MSVDSFPVTCSGRLQMYPLPPNPPLESLSPLVYYITQNGRGCNAVLIPLTASEIQIN